jgi:hypothetical protein
VTLSITSWRSGWRGSAGRSRFTCLALVASVLDLEVARTLARDNDLGVPGTQFDLTDQPAVPYFRGNWALADATELVVRSYALARTRAKF